ncbi:intracellular septation protein [Chitinivorax tropicus]|uniref:Inner membrane-spanning protein YciB n=1 Tax=Chitinivorax tropicus TaxID=714531 RepID=A0A840MHF6_9PROT|nr:septation protein A [Chitinivorax tropicus]MBB5016955.1 intracellular septation protein [Chitinivorax tropicus]
MKFLFDLFPIILFFVTYFVTDKDIFAATAVTIAATIAQVAWMWFKHRKVDGMLLLSLFLVVGLGSLTLVFHNKTFIMWKPTALYWAFAVTLAGAKLALGKNLIRSVMEKQMTLPEPIWSRLMWSWAGFFVFMGALNLFVAFRFSEETWVKFKMFGGLGLMLVFVVLQSMMLAKYIEDTPEKND